MLWEKGRIIILLFMKETIYHPNDEIGNILLNA